MSVDITQLFRIVRRLEVSHTLRAFVAVLAPLVSLTAMIRMIIQTKRLIEIDPPFSEALGILALLLFFTVLGVVLPLAFLVTDWLARKDVWRHIAAITGAMLGAFGLMLGGALIYLLTKVMAEVDELALGVSGRGWLLIGGLPLLILLGAWLTATSRHARLILTGVLMGVAGLLASVMAWGVWLTIRDEGGGVPTVIGLLLVVAFAVWWIVHAVRVRIELSGNYPRSLLLGALSREGFWVRFAFLIGLPSSMWNLRAMGRKEFWAFTVSRPMVYLGVLVLTKGGNYFNNGKLVLPLSVGLIIGGHLAFYAGKRFAARRLWDPENLKDARPPILFLRSFKDDQFNYKRSKWNIVGRWLDLWSFRRNVDETLIDEMAQYGPVVALGRPGEKKIPFGALRHYSTCEEWQDLITATAKRARAIVICAGESPGVLWEYELLGKENLLDRSILLFRPADSGRSSNQRALSEFLRRTSLNVSDIECPTSELIAFLPFQNRPVLLRAATPTAAPYVVALRGFFQGCSFAQFR